MRLSRKSPTLAAIEILTRVKISRRGTRGSAWDFQLGLLDLEGWPIKIRCWTELILQSDIRVVGSTWYSYQVYESPYPEVLAYISNLPDYYVLYGTK